MRRTQLAVAMLVAVSSVHVGAQGRGKAKPAVPAQTPATTQRGNNASAQGQAARQLKGANGPLHSEGRGRGPGKALQAVGERRETRGEKVEARGERREARGETLTDSGKARRGAVLQRQGTALENRGTRMQNQGERMETRGKRREGIAAKVDTARAKKKP